MKKFKSELLVFQVLESRNSVEKRLCKFEAEGQEFVTFSRHCSCSRELGKQVTNTGKKLEYGTYLDNYSNRIVFKIFHLLFGGEVCGAHFVGISMLSGDPLTVC